MFTQIIPIECEKFSFASSSKKLRLVDGQVYASGQVRSSESRELKELRELSEFNWLS